MGYRTVKEIDLSPDSDSPQWLGWDRDAQAEWLGLGWGTHRDCRNLEEASDPAWGASTRAFWRRRHLIDEREPGPGRVGKNRTGSWYGKCKGPEVQRSLGCSVPTKEASVAELAVRSRRWGGVTDTAGGDRLG